MRKIVTVPIYFSALLFIFTLAFGAALTAGDIHERTGQDIDNALGELNNQFPGMVANAGRGSAAGGPVGQIVTVDPPGPVVTTQQHLDDVNENLQQFRDGEKPFGQARTDANNLQGDYAADRSRGTRTDDKPVDQRDIEKTQGRIPVNNPVPMAHHH